MCPRRPNSARALGLRHVPALICRQMPHCIPCNRKQALRQRDDPEHVQRYDDHLRRSHCHDLRIPANDDRVGMVSGMRPTPDNRIAHDHEAGNLVHHRIHPAAAEGRTVPTLVPPRVGTSAVEHAIDQQDWQRPPGSPQGDCPSASQRQQGKPETNVAQRRTIAPFHQVL